MVHDVASVHNAKCNYLAAKTEKSCEWWYFQHHDLPSISFARAQTALAARSAHGIIAANRCN